MNEKDVKQTEKVRDKERAKANLLQGALEEFAAKGFTGASIREIAARNGLSHGMIRYHYESKEKLWFAAVEFLFDRLHTYMYENGIDQKMLLAGDKLSFQKWLRLNVYYWAKHPEHARIMIQESVVPSVRLDKVIQSHVKSDHLFGLKFIQALQAKAVLPPAIPPVSIMYMIVGASQLIFALAPEAMSSYQIDVLSETAIEAHADAVVAIFAPD